jgi:phage FluMu protein Com
MIFTRHNKQTRDISPFYVCQYCDGNIRRETRTSYVYLLFIRLFRTAKEDNLRCKSCDRVLSKAEIKHVPVEEKRITKEDNGLVKQERLNRYPDKTIVNISYDSKNAIPHTYYPELLSSTIIGIMECIAKLDNEIVLEQMDNYHYVKDEYSDYEREIEEVAKQIRENDVETGQQYILDQYKKCKVKLGNDEIQFILNQAFSVTKEQLFLDMEVEDFFKRLLMVDGYGELRLESVILSYRSKWIQSSF